jgi:CRISPR-associated protein Csm3
MTHKLISKIIITGTVFAETGLMIGNSSAALEIGGTDKQIIRNPINKMPYIPGSSLKGKMRSLLEQKCGTVNLEGEATMNPDKEAAALFGYIKASDSKDPEAAAAQKDKTKTGKERYQQPSRLIVRDGEMTNSTKFKDTELLYTEIKAENTVNRITAKANPRFFERVPKGAEFNLNMTLNIFEGDDETKQLGLIYECLRLVKDDYLGGGGSRGNGMVDFKITKIERRSDKYYKEGIIDAPLTIHSDFV